MSNVTINISNVSSVKDITNAVRRSLKEDKALTPGDKLVLKDVTISVKDAPKRPKSQDQRHIREWAAKNGFTVGKRGRLIPEVKEAYAAAHPA